MDSRIKLKLPFVVLIGFNLVVLCFCSDAPHFMIQHMMSGKVLMPTETTGDWIKNVIVIKDADNASHATFKVILNDDTWGFLVHVNSGWSIQPFRVKRNPEKGTWLLLTPIRHDGTLWVLDQKKHVIKHFKGKYIHLNSEDIDEPVNGDIAILNYDLEDGMRWRFAEPFQLGNKI